METSIWGLVIIGGPILLGLVLIFVILSNRKHREPTEIARNEQATRDLRERLNEEDKAGGS